LICVNHFKLTGSKLSRKHRNNYVSIPAPSTTACYNVRRDRAEVKQHESPSARLALSRVQSQVVPDPHVQTRNVEQDRARERSARGAEFANAKARLNRLAGRAAG
jgi:hypothetical protein